MPRKKIRNMHMHFSKHRSVENETQFLHIPNKLVCNSDDIVKYNRTFLSCALLNKKCVEPHMGIDIHMTFAGLRSCLGGGSIHSTKLRGRYEFNKSLTSRSLKPFFPMFVVIRHFPVHFA